MRAFAIASTGLVLGSSALMLTACSSVAPSAATGDFDGGVSEPRSAIALLDARVHREPNARRDWRAAGRGFAIDAGTRGLPSVRATFASARGDRLEVAYAGRRMVVRDASIVGRVGRVDDGRVVFEGAPREADVVWTADATRVESFHVLRAPASRAEITWALELPAGSRGLADDHRGGVDVLDEVGEPLFHVPRPYAIDANGVRRDAKLTFEGSTVRVELDGAGLAYPVLLDPAVEAAVWKLVATTGFSQRSGQVMASSPALGACLHGGTSLSGNVLSDFWCWNGTTWAGGASASTCTGAIPAGGQSLTGGPTGVHVFRMNSCTYSAETMVGRYAGAFTALASWGISGSTGGCQAAPTNVSKIAYDSKRGRFVLYGLYWGVDISASGCTKIPFIAESADGYTWTPAACVASKNCRAWDPSATFLFDPGIGKTLLLTSTENVAWDGSSWSTLPAGGGSFLGGGYDSTSKRMVFVGGAGVTFFDGTKWTTMATTPPANAQAVTWDDARHRGVLTGQSETWELYFRGGACMANADCDTGHCVDGVCCEQASCATCQACNTTGSPGQCAAVTNAPDPDTCTGTKSCDATGACKVKAGQTCGAASQCLSGFCVDGVCCDSACTGRCQTCLGSFKPSGADGTCGPVKAGADPDSECPDEGATSCKRDGFCDGIGACRNYAKDTSCGPTTCSGTKVTGNTCDGLGVCASNPTGTDCAPFACSAGKCATSCTTNAECAAGSWCSGGACTSQLVQGDACTLGASCPSGHCVDGACCDTACTGQCEACDVAGVVGVCTPVAGAPHRSRTPCSDGAGDVCKVRECDGVAGHGGSCQGYKNGITTACGSASCANAKYTPAPTCDGAGACPAAHETSCVPYACDDTGCKKSCATAADCADKYTCNAGKCEAVTTTCSDDGLSEIAADKTTHTCAPYLCKNQQCRTRCADGTDCAPGNRCNEDGACVPSDAGGAADSGGCGVTSRGAKLEAAFLLATLAAIGLHARGRRRAT